MAKQYFYLVCENYSKSYCSPKKIFLQEAPAIKYGRRLASKREEEGVTPEVKLLRQEITTNGVIESYLNLHPFSKLKSYFITFTTTEPAVVCKGCSESDALKSLGLDEIDFYKIDSIIEISDKDYVTTPSGRFFLKRDTVTSLGIPRVTRDSKLIRIFLAYNSSFRQVEYYKSKSDASRDYEFLKNIYSN